MPSSSLTFSGLAIAVLDFPAEWSAALSVSFRFPGSVTSSASGREARRPEAESLRHVAAVHLVLEDDEAQAFRQELATLAGGWVGLPLWADAKFGNAADDFIFAASCLYDFTADALVAGDSGLDDTHLYAPLLVGHLDDLPELPADTSTITDFSFTVTEDSPWALRLGVNATGTAGTWPASLAPDWSSRPVDQPAHGLTFATIGNQRERVVAGQERAFHWGQTADITLADRDAIRTLLAFFVASEGLRQPFDAPWWLAPGTPTAEAPASTKARFASATLTLDFLAPDLAATKVAVVQVPWEVTGVMGETPVQPARVFLYRFTYALPDPQVYRFTNWEHTLTRYADGDYAPGPFAHDNIVEALDLRSNAVSLTSHIFPGNPLLLFHPDVTEAPLTLEIFEIETDPIDPDSAVLKFTGTVKKPRVQERELTASVVFLGGLLDRQIPGVLTGPLCRAVFCDPRCGLTLSDYLETGTFTSAAGCVLTIATSAADAEGAFVDGTISLGTGLAYEKRNITASAPTGGGQLLTVDWPIRQAATGQAVAFYPGCARTMAACVAYGNLARMRAQPHMPTVNLSLPTLTPPNSGGKK